MGNFRGQMNSSTLPGNKSGQSEVLVVHDTKKIGKTNLYSLRNKNKNQKWKMALG